MSANSIHIERELKLNLQSEDNYNKVFSALKKRTNKVEQENIFFDTPSMVLMKDQNALRLRIIRPEDAQPSAELTLKGASEREGALSERSELTAPLAYTVANSAASGGLDLTTLSIAPIEEVLDLIGDEKLIPLVSFTNVRIASPWSAGAHHLTLELDRTRYATTEEFEVEVELAESDDPKVIERELIDYLHELGVSAQLQPKSKFRRALEYSGKAVSG